ncbi:hypothetical protein L1049_006380 [Liquidambar formosana]|uniref:Uncharacterized protein n=1 Tax=Liquidambar formosana TaxID=63359 RepID=A0AAP0RH37_LIQFO
MKKPEQEEAKPDGLEITSIGSLYNGPWDKKYWSSSRGKDRYPYPVGYKAVRTHNGGILKMEIREGLKGPLFVITAADGQSCSGQTPDITWESFQKKGCPRVKLLPGKRLSCKIDGVEFFGFRNPFVQRLLRELVANVNGIAERSLLSSIFCNEASGTEHDTQCSDPCTYPDLLADLARPQITKKRSRKHKIINKKSSIGRSSPKKLRHQDLTGNAESSNSRQENQWNHMDRNFMTSSVLKEENNVPNHPGALPLLMNLETVVLGKNSPFRAQDHLREEALLSQEESKLVSSENFITEAVANGLSTEEKPFDRSQDTEMLGLSFSMATQDRNGGAPIPKDASGICVPDTLDLLQDNTSDSAPNRPKESSSNVKDGSISAHMVISDGSPTESHPEEEMGTSISNASSEKSDFDSVGQEIAKSMMTVLLPQALPLLKKASKKKNTTIIPLEISSCMVKSQEENNGSGHFVVVTSPARMPAESSLVEREGKMHVLSKISSSVPSFEHINSIIPDSFESDAHLNQVPLFSDIVEADQAPDKDTCIPDTLGPLSSVNASKESSVCHVKTSGCKEIFCSDVLMASNKRPQSDAGCVSTSVDISDANLMGKVGCVGISHEEINIKTRGAGTGNTPFTQITDVTHLTKKYNGPLSESIICRNFGDGCVLDTHPVTGTLLAPEILQEVVTEFKGPEPWSLKQGTNLRGHSTSDGNEAQTGSDLKPHTNKELNSELEGLVKLVGCYVHPMPVLSVLLRTKGNEIYICVLCGLLVNKDRILFMYKLPIKDPREECPSFIGHASIMLPISEDAFGSQIALDRSGLQLTPDGQCLVLLNSIKAPYCRERNIHCLCSACTLDCFEENAVNIVQVKLGYVSLVAKLKTVGSVHCILVCEPDHLVAVEEGGRLHLWIMNSTWSAQTEEFFIPTYDCISPCVVELKKIPKCSHLVVGHNGFGEFGLWNILKRILISRFSAPSLSVFQFVPISLFNWERKGPVFSNPSAEECINRIMAETKMWFSERSKNDAFLPSEEKDMAIWLLLSTVPNSDAPCNFKSDCQMNPIGWWRLALLVNNMVIMGSALDSRAAAIAASAGHGIIATCDGLVYLWELSTGMRIGNLHCFKGGGVSCIATDDSRSGVLAVAGNGGQLLIYLHSQGFCKLTKG